VELREKRMQTPWLLLGLEPAITISPWVGKLTPDTELPHQALRKLKLFIEKLSK
jgi:hypothetical protein